MHKVSRRKCISVLSIPLLTGCLSNNKSQPGLGEVYIRNEQLTESNVAVTISKNGEVLHEKEYKLSGTDNGSWGETSIRENWMGEYVPYEVTIEVDNIGETSYHTEDFLNMAGETQNIDCFELTIVIGKGIVDFRPNAEESCTI
ncbi:hypothetical protein [Natronobacterium haloterrestre]|uniref:hypothetical protein n=1 Tax=Natronobacterium haloterrestre TaxID=148448 RepID=UPI000A478712|nr:hypothetical protein [Halobiforma haloterrestris]